jgi:hypothetical protein
MNANKKPRVKKAKTPAQVIAMNQFIRPKKTISRFYFFNVIELRRA